MRITLLASLVLLLAACGSAKRGESDTSGDVPSDAVSDVASDVADAADTADATDDTIEDLAVDAAADLPDQSPEDTQSPGDTVSDADAATPSRLVLDPATLFFFSLPIDSYRVAVSGLDPVADMCATIVFDYSNTDHDFEAHCDRFGEHFPYVLVVPDGAESCVGAWDYGTQLETLATQGCFDAAELPPPGLDLADLEVEVRGAAFTGTVAVDNRPTFTPSPVSLGLVYTTDIPEDVWIQTGDAYGLPAWVEILKDGAPLLIHDRCDVPPCDDPDAGVCGIAFQMVRSLTHGSYGGSAWLTWDGRVRAERADGSCRERTPAAPGDYVARFCFGWAKSEDAAGAVVTTPTCVEEPFTYPTPRVVAHADFGG
jgi:hypothetical protein